MCLLTLMTKNLNWCVVSFKYILLSSSKFWLGSKNLFDEKNRSSYAAWKNDFFWSAVTHRNSSILLAADIQLIKWRRFSVFITLSTFPRERKSTRFECNYIKCCFVYHFSSYQPTMMFILQLLSIFSLLTVNTLVSSTSFTTDCQIIDGQTFQPNSTTSFLASYQFLGSFSPIPIDCAHVCLRWSNCRTAVFEQNAKTCTMYSENLAFSGRLVTNSTGIFTTIITDKPPS